MLSSILSRKLLDEGFWDALEVDKPKHGIVLDEQKRLESKFRVTIRQSKDRESFSVKGNLERIQQLVEEVHALLNEYNKNYFLMIFFKF